MLTSLGVSNVSFGVGLPARAVAQLASSCTTASRPGSTWRWSTRTTSRRTRRSARRERALADDLVLNRREDALERFIAHFEARRRAPRRPRSPTRPRAWSPRRRCTSTSCGARRTASRTGSTARVEKIGAVPDAQRRAAAGDEGGRRQVRRRRADPAVRAAERRGDEARRRAARAVPRQARGLHEGHRRARDGLRRRARHRQVARQHDPHQQRLHGRRPRQAGPDRHDHRRRPRARRDRDRAERAARLDVEADAAVRLRAALARARVPGADRRRGDQPQVRPARDLPRRQGVRRDLRARRLLLQGRVRGPGRDGPARRRRRARALVAKVREDARKLREEGETEVVPTDDDSVRSPAAHRQPGARAAVLGRARDPRRPRRGLPPPRHARAVQAPLGRHAA